MRRAAKWIGGILLALLLLPVLLLLFANTQPGREALVRLTSRLTGDTVRLSGLTGRFPDALRAARVELRDARGDYATIDGLVLDWSPLELLHRRLVIDRLTAARIDAIRMPVSSSSSNSGVPVSVVLHELRVDRLDIGAALAGVSAAVALDGSGELTSETAFSGTADIRDLAAAGAYHLTGTMDAARLQAELRVREPPRGVIASIAGLPDLGGLTLDATLNGPRDAVATRLTLGAGPLRAELGGTLDLEHAAADLTVSAGAPAMQPRPDLSWQAVALEAQVRGPFARLDATGRLNIDSLSAAGAAIGRVAADVAGNAGAIHAEAQVTDIRLPGPEPNLLAGDPLTVQADVQLDAPDRPAHLVVRHRLFDADADVRTAIEQRLDGTVRVADLAPFAAIGHVPMDGSLTLTLHAAQQGDISRLDLDAVIGVTGGQPQAKAVVGDEGRLNLSATLQGSDLTLSRLHFDGRAAMLDAEGKLAGNQADFTWSLAMNDLAAAEPRLAGQLRAAGRLGGTTDDLTATADIEGNVAANGLASGPLTVQIEASGLPSRPGGHITARGDLLNAPVDLVVALRQTDEGFAVDIERAAWKTLQADGALRLPTATMVPTGNLRLSIARLADLAPLVGQPVAGSLTATFSAAGTDQPKLEAKLDAEGLRLGTLGGTIHATASGTANALAVKLAADLPQFQGAPARLNAAATVDTLGRSAEVSSLQAEWRQQAVRLLAPARIGFAQEISVDRLRLGLRQAVLDVSGRVGATLDLTATLRDLPVDIAEVVAPGFAADGSVQAEARITGTSAKPVGRVKLAATGLRMRSGPARALPAASINATAELNGVAAQLDMRATAGRSRLTVAGAAPLGTSGALDLHATGGVDLAMAEPILAAGGRHVRGQVNFDARITGTATAPAVAGTAQLSGGEVQDFSSGLHLTAITARLQGNGATLRVEQLSATAGRGTINASGSIGVMQAGLPVDLTLTARNAEPLASDLLTAQLDADLTIRGEAAGQLAVGGGVRVRRADIRIPERMPAKIVVLPIAQPGAKPAPPAVASVVALNLTIEAPGQVFVRGRGLDAEFGGSMKVGGTATAPVTTGGLTLRRGQINVAGHTLTFTEGTISFNGGSMANPALRIVATSSTASVVATLTIGGTAQEPKITLSSTPPLPQDEVLAQLLFGSSVGKLGALEVAEIAAGLATLTGAGGVGDPLDKVRQGLGLDRLSVTSGAGGSPALEAGRYIAPRLYLGAKQSASGGAQANVQFDITKGLKLQATTGAGGGSATGFGSSSTNTSNGTSVGLSYQFEY
jgi:translocation and assembly module TamB